MGLELQRLWLLERHARATLREWVDNENCFGIGYPICTDKLINLLNKVSGAMLPIN
jgi:hypothetical protein